MLTIVGESYQSNKTFPTRKGTIYLLRVYVAVINRNKDLGQLSVFHLIYIKNLTGEV